MYSNAAVPLVKWKNGNDYDNNCNFQGNNCQHFYYDEDNYNINPSDFTVNYLISK